MRQFGNEAIKRNLIEWIILVVILVGNLFSNSIHAQKKKDSCCILKQDLIGIWQRNTGMVGNGLGQNFRFFKNDSFILNIGDDGDDVRDIIMLKGKYRLLEDKLYFTITSRTVVDGPIGTADGGIDFNIFDISGGKVKEISEQNPKELSDPCYITLFSKKHIEISREKYYKVSNNPHDKKL